MSGEEVFALAEHIDEKYHRSFAVQVLIVSQHLLELLRFLSIYLVQSNVF